MVEAPLRRHFILYRMNDLFWRHCIYYMENSPLSVSKLFFLRLVQKRVFFLSPVDDESEQMIINDELEL